MADKDMILLVLLGAIAFACLVLMMKGLTSGVPPGQRGLKGTSFATSKPLMILQMAMLFLLFCASLGAATWMFFRHNFS